MQSTGVKTSSYEGLLRDENPFHDQKESLRRFNSKFMSQAAHSSQILQNKATTCFEVSRIASNCKTHRGKNTTKWHATPKVPVPVFVSGSKFRKMPTAGSLDLHDQTLSVLVPDQPTSGGSAIAEEPTTQA